MPLSKLKSEQALREELAKAFQETSEGRYGVDVSTGLAIRENALGPDHPDVATTLENMAKLYNEIGKKHEARRLEERAKGIRSRNQ
ncbi:MAG: tetratricopeptide repeat protein [candidate division NC10 bacterium]